MITNYVTQERLRCQSGFEIVPKTEDISFEYLPRVTLTHLRHPGVLGANAGPPTHHMPPMPPRPGPQAPPPSQFLWLLPVVHRRPGLPIHIHPSATHHDASNIMLESFLVKKSSIIKLNMHETVSSELSPLNCRYMV